MQADLFYPIANVQAIRSLIMRVAKEQHFEKYGLTNQFVIISVQEVVALAIQAVSFFLNCRIESIHNGQN